MTSGDQLNGAASLNAARMRGDISRSGSPRDAAGVQRFFKENVRSRGWKTPALRRYARSIRKEILAAGGETLVFDVDGILLTRTDRNGNETTYDYVDADSDGYPEAWWLPAANNIPAGYATQGSKYSQIPGAADEPGAARIRRVLVALQHDRTAGVRSVADAVDLALDALEGQPSAAERSGAEHLLERDPELGTRRLPMDLEGPAQLGVRVAGHDASTPPGAAGTPTRLRGCAQPSTSSACVSSAS